jgi:hypothetical protein
VINSHLLYQLSYRGTFYFLLIAEPVNPFLHLRRAILRFLKQLSSLKNV